TTDAVNSRLKRAREILRDRLARRGWPMSVGAIATALTSASANAGVPATLMRQTIAVSARYAVTPAASGASAAAVAVATGLAASGTVKKLLCGALLVGAVLAAATAALAWPKEGEALPRAVTLADDDKKEPDAKEKTPPPNTKPGKQKHIIILWMNGGP